LKKARYWDISDDELVEDLSVSSDSGDYYSGDYDKHGQRVARAPTAHVTANTISAKHSSTAANLREPSAVSRPNKQQQPTHDGNNNDDDDDNNDNRKKHKTTGGDNSET